MFEPVHLSYFGDVPCVWASAAQIRLDERKQDFGEHVREVCRGLPHVELSPPRDAILPRMSDGTAMAALCRDAALRDECELGGSPTHYLGQGRSEALRERGLRHPEGQRRRDARAARKRRELALRAPGQPPPSAPSMWKRGSEMRRLWQWGHLPGRV